MSRKDTVWGARHRFEEEEIERILKYYEKVLGIRITKLEASAILAKRSNLTFLSDVAAKKLIRELRGIL